MAPGFHAALALLLAFMCVLDLKNTGVSNASSSVLAQVPLVWPFTSGLSRSHNTPCTSLPLQNTIGLHACGAGPLFRQCLRHPSSMCEHTA